MDGPQVITPETTAKLNELLGWLMESVKGGGEFVKAQAPDVARDMVLWGAWGGWLGAVGSIIGAVVIVVCFTAALRRIWKWAHEPNGDEGAAIVFSVFGGIGTVIVVVLMAVAFVDCASRGLKATVSPKLYVLEQVRSMLK